MSDCKECKPPKRHPGCHSTCESYLKSAEEAKQRRNIIQKEREQDYNFKCARFGKTVKR